MKISALALFLSITLSFTLSCMTKTENSGKADPASRQQAPPPDNNHSAAVDKILQGSTEQPMYEGLNAYNTILKLKERLSDAERAFNIQISPASISIIVTNPGENNLDETEKQRGLHPCNRYELTMKSIEGPFPQKLSGINGRTFDLLNDIDLKNLSEFRKSIIQKVQFDKPKPGGVTIEKISGKVYWSCYVQSDAAENDINSPVIKALVYADERGNIVRIQNTGKYDSK